MNAFEVVQPESFGKCNFDWSECFICQKKTGEELIAPSKKPGN